MSAKAAGAGRPLHWTWLGRVPYGWALELQEAIRRDLRAGGGPERLLLLEHDPVFTLGRSAGAQDLLADPAWLRARGVAVHESNRGGQVTYHGPGQLVGYPIVDLDPDRRDVRRYVQDLQAVLIDLLAGLGVDAGRRSGPEHIGVWVDNRKIASIGVHLARWITIHGFALNVATDLTRFGGIVACGLPDVVMTSVEVETRARVAAPDPRSLAARTAELFAQRFERRLVAAAAAELFGRYGAPTAPTAPAAGTPA